MPRGRKILAQPRYKLCGGFAFRGCHQHGRKSGVVLGQQAAQGAFHPRVAPATGTMKGRGRPLRVGHGGRRSSLLPPGAQSLACAGQNKQQALLHHQHKPQPKHGNTSSLPHSIFERPHSQGQARGHSGAQPCGESLAPGDRPPVARTPGAFQGKGSQRGFFPVASPRGGERKSLYRPDDLSLLRAARSHRRSRARPGCDGPPRSAADHFSDGSRLPPGPPPPAGP